MSDRSAPVLDRLTLTPRVRSATTQIRIGRGLLQRLPKLLMELAPAPAYAVVADSTVAGLYGEGSREALEAAGVQARLFRFPAGEGSKSPARWADLVEGFGEMALGRDGCVVALGGGVTGDLAGFAAATYARGVKLVQVPTSLLAMIDASLGGKTGLDLRAGKNLAGSFHDPAAVVVDPGLLETLPPEELRTGLAEAVKHGAIADAAYLEFLGRSGGAIEALEPDAVDRVIAESVRIKVGVVERDARESGERAILNFGHTIAHAIERITEYAVPHGHAVAMGMVAEARIGERLGVTEGGTADELEEVLRGLRLPVALPSQIEPAALLQAAGTDKKARDGRARYVLIARIGAAARASDGGWTHAVPDAEVAATLATESGPSAPGRAPSTSGRDV